VTDGRLPWVEEGSRDGPILVLVNSLGSTMAIWDPLLEALGRDHRVVRFDLRGHGRSPAVPGPYEIADLGHDLVDLLDALDAASASVCGISIGGMGALWLAAHAPDRVDRLVVGCTSARLGPPEAWAERAALVRRAGMEAVADLVARRWVTPGWASAHPDGLARLHEMIASCEPAGYADWCGAIERMDLRMELASIAAPTLVLGGAEDRAIPTGDLDALADGIAGARLAFVAGAAHVPMIEAPLAVGARILEHLGAPGGGSR
jgi:3-oxoadipate enol-lactonase